MNTFAPVSTIMTTKLLTVDSHDPLSKVKELFDNHTIHHIPVVRYKQLIGLISKTDFEYFMGGLDYYKNDEETISYHLEHSTAEAIMTSRLAKMEPTDRINVALDIFLRNRFHALPIVDGDELVGIVTPFDILKALDKEVPSDPTDVYVS